MTILPKGQSAGSQSVSDAIQRHTPENAPFRAGILLSGASVSTSPVPSFTAFNGFAAGVGCNQAPGAARLACLKAVPAQTIRSFVNGPTSGAFGTTVVDKYAINFSTLMKKCLVLGSVTVFDDPLQRIRTGLTARKPIIIGSMEDDGTVFTVGMSNLTAFLQGTLGPIASAISPNLVRSLYPGLNDSQVIADVFRDLIFRWFVMHLSRFKC
jgi:carboxylesterase type B